MYMLYIVIAFYCVSKLKVFCKLAEELTELDKDIEKLAQKHLKLVEFISIANSSLGNAIFCQLMTALGLFVFASFHLHNGVDYCVTVLFATIMLQLFMYCFLSQYVYTMVSYER